MPVSFSVNKLWQDLTGKSKSNPVNIVAQRFLRVFHDHGVQTTQIPRLLPAIKLDDLKSEDALLATLTHDVLDQTARLFGIRVEWLEGVDDKIYGWLSCYKQPDIFFEHFAMLNLDKDDLLNFPIRVITSTNDLDYTDPRQQLLALIIVEQIAVLGDDLIHRYHVYRDSWDWSHKPARIQLKAMIRVATDSPVPLFAVTQSEIEKVLNGELIPHKFVEGCQITDPSLEDYVHTAEESVVAKEIDEIPEVMRYIEKLRIRPPVVKEPPIEPAPGPESTPQQPGEPNKSGKRADNNRDLWEPVRAVASAWWAEEGESLNITAAAKRIKKMPHLKAAALGESAIRKHIADLAPSNVRGKSGRKHNKST